MFKKNLELRRLKAVNSYIESTVDLTTSVAYMAKGVVDFSEKFVNGELDISRREAIKTINTSIRLADKADAEIQRLSKRIRRRSRHLDQGIRTAALEVADIAEGYSNSVLQTLYSSLGKVRGNHEY